MYAYCSTAAYADGCCQNLVDPDFNGSPFDSTPFIWDNQVFLEVLLAVRLGISLILLLYSCSWLWNSPLTVPLLLRVVNSRRLK
jgi:hypothetical protein